jgi:hypothetical protein
MCGVYARICTYSLYSVQIIISIFYTYSSLVFIMRHSLCWWQILKCIHYFYYGSFGYLRLILITREEAGTATISFVVNTGQLY